MGVDDESRRIIAFDACDRPLACEGSEFQSTGARENRVYPLSSGRPGPKDPARTAYMIPFMRAFDDPNYNTVAFVCGEIEISRAPRTMTVFSM